MLGAVLKDQFGVLLEEDVGSRPACLACRRLGVSLTMQKIF